MRTACLKPLHSDAACTSIPKNDWKIPIDARHFHPTFLMVQKPPFLTCLACYFIFPQLFRIQKSPPEVPMDALSGR